MELRNDPNEKLTISRKSDGETEVGIPDYGVILPLSFEKSLSDFPALMSDPSGYKDLELVAAYVLAHFVDRNSTNTPPEFKRRSDHLCFLERK